MAQPCEAKGVVNVWCGYCYSNLQGRSAYKGHRAYHPRVIPINGGLEMALKKRDAGLNGAPTGGKAKPGNWGKGYPSLWEFISSVVYEDGSARVPATLTIFVDAGTVKLCLNDRDQGLTGWASADTVEGAFGALEKALADDKLEWKVSGGGQNRKKR